MSQSTSTSSSMSTSRRSLARAGVALAAAVAALALPATSATASAAVAAESHLTLTILPDTPDIGNPRTTVLLECGPAGGDHPDPLLACEELTAVDGRFEDLDRPAFCTSEWDPVTITATGTWQGREVHFTDTYTNRMCAANATGGVFGF
ncbi:SSI family serine proteinase inhibitor [Streptomyces sp. 4N509B]|uniref:SSI family serine proteinase inhibitor n=1 Tax=Streptomyces sp. 4N509B TaxID=3457413 RepID=UPI003FD595CB